MIMAGEDLEFTTFDGDVITKNDYRTQIIEEYIDANYNGLSKVTDFTTGSEALHLADIIASLMFEKREAVDSNYRMSMLHYMEGEFLDNYGDMRGVHRYPSSPSTLIVTFRRKEGVTGNIDIPDGLVVATVDAISFQCDIQNDTGYMRLAPEINEIQVPVICEQEGDYTNVDANSITLIIDNTILEDKVDVNNDYSVKYGVEHQMSNYTLGTDIESDNDYRNRIMLSPAEAPTGSLAWYKATALLASYYEEYPIHDVLCEKHTIGTYDITIFYNPIDRTDYITDPTTSQTVLKATYAIDGHFALPEYDIVGINLELALAVQEPVLVSVNSGVQYYIAVLLEAGYDLELLTSAIEKKVDDFNNELEIGVEVMPTNLASMVEDVEGVAVCKIIKEDDGAYTECTGQIDIEYNKVGLVDSSIKDNIVLLDFDLNLGD